MQRAVGYREIGCATLAFCDAKGDLISAIRFGRGPDPKKLSLKETLRKDLAHILAQHPELRLAKVTDAGSDNWEYLATPSSRSKPSTKMAISRPSEGSSSPSLGRRNTPTWKTAIASGSGKPRPLRSIFAPTIRA